MDAALVLFEEGSTMFCWDCRITIRMDWELMELCKSVGRKREVGDCWEIVGMRVLDDMDDVRTGVN